MPLVATVPATRFFISFLGRQSILNFRNIEIHKKISFFHWILIASCFINLSCQKNASDDSTSGPVKSAAELRLAAETTPIELRKLAQKDRDTLSEVSLEGTLGVQPRVRNAAAAFFGGLRGRDFQNFLDTRIRYFLTEDEVNQMTFTESFLSTLSENFQSLKIDSSGSDSSESGSAQVEIAASNLGGVLWLKAVGLGQTNPVLHFRGLSVPLNNSRVGLMRIGSGYVPAYLFKNGDRFDVPALFRQAILLHEARHSDCTGGLSKQDLKDLKDIFADDSKTLKLQSVACLHQHILCPVGHDYQNLPACDEEAWGAYTAGAIFAALSANTLPAGIQRRYMQMTAADQLSRVQIDLEKMFDGGYGPPDLSSTSTLP